MTKYKKLKTRWLIVQVAFMWPSISFGVCFSDNTFRCGIGPFYIAIWKRREVD